MPARELPRATFLPPIGYFPAMDRRSLYNDDIYAWTQQQAEALRRLAGTRRDLPNELDLENVAEEIEDVGKSELHRVESFVRLILLHLVKAASARDARAGDHWRKEVRIWRIDLRKDLTASMRAKIDLDAAWEVAVTKAEIDLATAGDQVIPGLPGRFPFAVDDLAGEPLRFRRDGGAGSGRRREARPLASLGRPVDYRGARLARMRCRVRRCMLSRRAVSETLRPHSS